MTLRQQLPLLQQKIHHGQQRIWKPPESIQWKQIQPFIRNHSNLCVYTDSFQIDRKISPETIMHCKKVQLHLSSSQQDILKRWCYAYAKMYNAALQQIKHLYSTQQLIITNYQKLRTQYLKRVRDQLIQESSHPKYDAATHIKTHMMDAAVQLVCANYKSALSNYKAGNIKHFRMRYWKKKTVLRLDIEPSYITNQGICTKVLGKMKATYDNDPFSWSTIDKTCQLQYNRNANTFYLLVPYDLPTQEVHHRHGWIALDPGIRTFLTGLSQQEVIKIGDGLSIKITKYLKRLDRCINQKRKAQRLRDKVRHLVDDVHWKAANYLAQNYDTILIGDMSAKSVIRGKSTGLAASVKRSMMALSLFRFHQRLVFKAQQYRSQVILVNEAYTTKVCSCCGTINENIGTQRIFSCADCGHTCDRDVDGARCIAIQGLM